jgi:hypothetical protein
MPSLRKDLRSQLEKAVLAARRAAEAGAREALTALGVGESKAYEHLSPADKALRVQLRARGRQAGDVLDDRTGRQPVDHLVTVAGYEHWHRMLFARFLAENGLLLEPEHRVAVSLTDVEELARDAKTDIWDLAGRFAQRMLPAVFRPDDPALALALPPESRQALEKLVASLPREVFLADDSLGWTYQFWQAQRKAEVNESGVKIGADELSPVTQLFTEDYMVEFLLHNTLGAWWAGKVLGRDGSPQPSASATEADLRGLVALPPRDGLPSIEWTYLRFVQESGTGVPPVDAESSGQPKTQNSEPKTIAAWKPAAGTFPGWPKETKAVTVLDPCMGSGHFLVFALPILARLRMEEENLSAAAAVAAVLRDNLFGLELDERCTQIAAFNLALAAWKLAGWHVLPPLHLACSGLSIGATKEEWLQLADRAAARLAAARGEPDSDAANLSQHLRYGMEHLHDLFRQAPVLGSLINPRGIEDEGLLSRWEELRPLVEEALAPEESAPEAPEMAVTARGLAKAAEILSGRFTMVTTNVPYLGLNKQNDFLKRHCAAVFPNAKADLATCFVERCIYFCVNGGSVALVTPQSWLFLGTYRKLRQTLLANGTFNAVAKLGPGAFETISGEVVNAALVEISRASAREDAYFVGIDVADENTIAGKAEQLRISTAMISQQRAQTRNADSRIVLSEVSSGSLLLELANSYEGIGCGDLERFSRTFTEVPNWGQDWRAFRGTTKSAGIHAGAESIIYWQDGEGDIYELAELLRDRLKNTWRRGCQAWNKRGLAVNRMGDLLAEIYRGEIFDSNIAAIIPKDEEQLLPIWLFVSSEQFREEVRRIDQSMKITNVTFLKVPFDLAHWQQIAAEKYPHGLPTPYSSDPTQWLFNGHPKDSDQPLHVALARLLGYRWPRQTGSSFPDCPALEMDGLEPFADQDGIVCLSPLRGEPAAAERLRGLLSAALGTFDEHALISGAGGESDTLEEWLRAEAFEQHCKLFHHRPFVWHLWDGRPDGFHALVNYHSLAAPGGEGRKLLETLAFSYLGDWIRKQQDDAKRHEPGAEDRLIAAQFLRKELEAILAGEPPYDLFVRWKPLHKQPIGWEPDLNDGVRLNIRPFILAKNVARKGAGLLRFKPNISWEKADRGKEPARPKEDFPWFWSWTGDQPDFPGGAEFDGNRWNACHYTGGAKRAARERKKGAEAT